MKRVLLVLLSVLTVGSPWSAVLAAKSGAGSGTAGGTAYGGNTGGQNPTWNADSGHGNYQQRARFLGNGPP